jgi:hypothetical protein
MTTSIVMISAVYATVFLYCMLSVVMMDVVMLSVALPFNVFQHEKVLKLCLYNHINIVLQKGLEHKT